MKETMHTLAATIIETCTMRGLKIATAESCTGGMIAAALTDIPGSSAVFERGFVTYSNAAKQEMLGVDPALIATHGAVSEAVARAMVAGALAYSHADIAVSVTGIAGPGGGSVEKPVGLVWFGVATVNGVMSKKQLFSGDRQAIRQAAKEHALSLLLEN